MDLLAVTIALVLAFAGCASFYLASPHQRWRAAPLPAKPARAVALGLAVASLVAFLCAMRAAPAVFAFVSWVMLLLVVFPYVGALFTLRRER